MNILDETLTYLSVTFSIVLGLILLVDYSRTYQKLKYSIKKFIVDGFFKYLRSPIPYGFLAFFFVLNFWYMKLIYIFFTLTMIIIAFRRRDLKLKINTKITRLFIYMIIWMTFVGTVIGFNVDTFHKQTIARTFSFIIAFFMAFFALSIVTIFPLELVLSVINKKIFIRKLERVKPVLIVVPRLFDGNLQDIFVALDYEYKIVKVAVDNFYEDVNNGIVKNVPTAIVVTKSIPNTFFDDYHLAFTINGDDLRSHLTTVEEAKETLVYREFKNQKLNKKTNILAYGFKAN